MNAATGKDEVKLCIGHGKQQLKPHECIMIFISKNWNTVYDYVRDYKESFTAPGGNGVILLTYSIILTHGIEEI